MEEDLDLTLSPNQTGTAKSAPKQGRRANRNAFGEPATSNSQQNDFDISFGSPLKSRPQTEDLFLDDGPGNLPSRGGPPLRGRRRGGWSDEQQRAKTAKSVRIQSATGFINRDDVLGEDDDGEIPIIPDLDDVQDEDMALQVAEAPSVAVNRVATYKELDNDLLKHVAFATVDDIDLRLLTRSLAPETELREKDEMWNWDVLFAEITGELQKEWFPDVEEQEKLDAANERPYTAFNRFA